MSAPQPHPGPALKYSQQYRRCGKADCPTCAPPGRGHGPYWYAYWWEDGRVRSRYLGKQLPDTAPVLQVVPAPAPAGTLRVRTLGGFAVWQAGELIPAGRWKRRKAAVLFKALLSTPGCQMHREQLVDLLAAEDELDDGPKLLRSTLYLLRKILDAPGVATSHVQTTGDMVSLAPALERQAEIDWLDAAAFDQAAAEALAQHDIELCRTAITLYGGEYLPEDRYETWAERRRADLRGRYLAVLLMLADLSRAGEPDESVRCLRAALNEDPCHEDAARSLMELLAAQGRRDEALDVYRTLAAALEKEIGEAPARETRAVRARLLAVAPVAPLPAPRRTNLPAPLTSFVGREWERLEITRLLRAERGGGRQITLLGPGGCGKTRLALEIARGVLDEYPDGVWLAELGGLPRSADPDPALPAQTVATALGVPLQGDRAPLDVLVQHLASRRVLLVLDTCEHLVEASAVLAVALLQAAPELRILATSQAALGILGEMAWRVPSLSLPERDDLPAADLAAYEAVQLFLERARAAAPRFTLTDRNAAAVARICRRLDGIPLALELAAARLALLSADLLAARLDDRFSLLSGGNRAALPRQQTLRATIEWSVGLLPAMDRLLLRRLAVFAGGWTLDAAEAVCAGPDLPKRSLLDRLGNLVARSMVQVDEVESGMRYRLLESIRAFAQELGEAAGDLARAQIAHLSWCLALGTDAEPGLRGPAQAEWFARLEREHDNLRAALTWAIAHDAEAGLRLAAHLWWFWSSRGYLAEGRRWLETALAQAPTAPPILRARALQGAGVLARQQGDYQGATTLLEEALALRRALEDRPNSARLLGSLGVVAYFQGEYERATHLYQEALAVLREIGDTYGIAVWLNNLGLVVYAQGDYARAAALYQEALSLQRDVGDTLGIAGSLGNLGMVAHAQKDYERATDLYQQALTLQRELGERASIAISLGNLAELANLQGDHARTAALYEEALALQRELGDRRNSTVSLINLGAIVAQQGDERRARSLYEESLLLSGDIGARDLQADAIEHMSWLAATQGQLYQAAQLAGCAEALREALNIPLSAMSQDDHDRAVRAMQATLGEEAFAAAWAEGRALPLEEAIALAGAGHNRVSHG
jgi:predicted ATPase/DNA-binding SARP family transcriptional activator